MSWQVLTLLMTVLGPSAAHAHKLDPSMLDLRALDQENVRVQWNHALNDGLSKDLAPVFPERCTASSPPVSRLRNGVRSSVYRMRCMGGLAGQSIGVRGMGDSGADVFVRFIALDGSTATEVLGADQATWTLPLKGARTPDAGALQYFPMGIEHILFGFDHLLFVLGLVVLVGNRHRVLLGTITAFTFAHSVTLALSALDVIRIPARATEAVIALSILFLALELTRRSKNGGPTTITTRAPWAAAMFFGLLHGFGFAGALRDVGLPQDTLLEALFAFNLGVEFGQLCFVGALLLLGFLAKKISKQLFDSRWKELGPAYVMGSVSVFWLLDRVGSILRIF